MNTTRERNFILEAESEVYESGLFAVGFLVCSVIGLPGNCLALSYFIQTKSRNLATLLYIIACCIDVGSSMIHIPVAISLLNGRAPGILGHASICSLWFFILLLLQAMSMFVVMLLSLTRAIVILFPFYKVKKRAVILSVVVYLVYHCTWNTLYLTLAGHATYFPLVAYCLVYSENPSIIYLIFQANSSFCMWVPPVIVFLAFLVSLVKLLKSNMTDASHRRSRKASITITYFSLIFLLCNCFTFINQTLFTFTMLWYEGYPGPMYDNSFMLIYSWVLSEVFCTVLNASLNPLLYVWRMEDMRVWALRLFRRRSNVVSVQVAQSADE